MRQKIINDIIHGNIELSDFEFQLLKNPVVNRLHQILQNSVAYTVYPNMKASRFEHSLGALNYAGEMYKYGLINSEISQKYLEDKHSWIKKCIQKNKKEILSFSKECGVSSIILKNYLNENFKIDQDLSNLGAIIESPDFINRIEDFIGESFLNRNANSQNDICKGTNILLFQSVRLFGLFHDIGHLPLSHLFEFSIESLYENISDSLKSTDAREKVENSKSIEYESKLNELLESSDQIHELIGMNITRFIFQDELDSNSKKNHVNDFENKFLNSIIILLLREIWAEIIKAKKGHFYSLYSIVSSTIDCDRLDYVQRDGLLSGIAKYTGNTRRIVEMFCLGKNPNTDTEIIDNFLFMPSIQSLDSVEEMLHHRYRIYRYVINHHAVVRSNYIMQKVIENKLIQEIKKLNIDNKEINNEEYDLVPLLLKNVIDVASDITSLEPEKPNDEIISTYIQLTDFWLFSTLNKEFTNTLKKDTKNHSLQDLLLIEVYKSKRSFKSLWKRGHEFHTFIFEIGVEFLKNEKLIGIKEMIYKDIDLESSSSLNTFENHLKEYERLVASIDGFDQQIKKGTFKQENYVYSKNVSEKNKMEQSLTLLGKMVMKYVNLYDAYESPRLFKRLENKFKENNKDNDLHVLVSPTKIKPGIKNCYLIDRKYQNNIHNFNRFSEKARLMQEEIQNAIRFFVFYYDNGTIKSEDIKTTLIHYFMDEIILKNKTT